MIFQAILNAVSAIRESNPQLDELLLHPPTILGPNTLSEEQERAVQRIHEDLKEVRSITAASPCLFVIHARTSRCGGRCC